MENTFSPEAVKLQFDAEHGLSDLDRRQVYLKIIPPRWQFWARPRFENVSWLFDGYSQLEKASAVRRIPELLFQEEAAVESMISTRSRSLGPSNGLSMLYSKKYHVGPSKWFDVAHLGLFLVLGVAHLMS